MTDFWNHSPALASQLARVESILADSVSDPAFPLASQTREVVLSGGKMLRPAFVLIGAGFGRKRRGVGPAIGAAAGTAAGAEAERIAHIAAAVELIHAASLIHDDIIDQADIRRGLPSLHTRFGITNAILAGDWLFARSFRLVADHADTKSGRVLSRFVGSVCAAEIRQDLGKFRFATSRRDYLRTIAGKTAALFSLSLHVGAAEAGATPAVIQSLRRAGYDIGMAFQIIDDILDYESDGTTLRKPAGNDLKEGLCTLPLILALQNRGSELRPLLAKSGMDDANVARIVRIVAESGGLEQARQIAARFSDRAHAELERLPPCQARDELVAATDALLARRY